MGIGDGGDAAWFWVGTSQGVPQCVSEPWLLVFGCQHPWGLTSVRLVVVYEPMLKVWWSPSGSKTASASVLGGRKGVPGLQTSPVAE